MQQKFAYDVGLVSLTFYIFADIEFKVILISLLYTPNKVLPSFCWNLHLTLVHCHINTRRQSEYSVNKENPDRKEDYITISKELKLEKSQDRSPKDKEIIAEYPNRLRH